MTHKYIALSTREDGDYWIYSMEGSKLMFSDRCDGSNVQFSQLLNLKQNLISDRDSGYTSTRDPKKIAKFLMMQELLR